MHESESNPPEELASGVRLAWASGRGEGALADALTPEVRADDSRLAEVLAADAEERWERGGSPTLETYLDRVPELVSRPEACRALLLCELARRDDREHPEIGSRLKERMPRFAEHIDVVVGFFSAFGSERETEAPARWRSGGVSAGDRLGDYELRERIGRGSFGEVWRAWDAALERNVALKLIAAPENGELDTVLDEARAAAGLEHDNIVRVHAAGRFDGAGLLYIDTQLVGEPAPTPGDPGRVAVGRSLEEGAIRAERLAPRRAGEIMERVCRAVAAAHARGVTHGDLKPGNILLTPGGRPMVADFGLAVLAPARPDPGDAGRSVCIETGSGRITGTPAYMSPEQARGERATPLSDIYSLGATLAALLLGRAPFAPRPGSTRASLDVIEQVREDGPDLSALSTTHPTLWAICRRATARETGDRYVTADQMADDLRAWLDRRPTRARPLSAARRGWLWVGRHAAGVAVGLAVLGGLAGLSAWYVASITAAERKANAEATNYQAVLEFLTDMLESNKPSEAQGREITLRQKLDDASAQLRAGPPGSLPVAYSLNRVIGGTYMTLSQFDEAEWHLAEALRLASEMHGADHEETAHSLQRLGGLRVFQGRLAEAAELLERSRAMRERLNGADSVEHALVEHEFAGLMVAMGMYDRAGPPLEHAYGVLRSRLPANDERRILVANALGGLLTGTGRFEEAERVIADAAAGMIESRGPRNPETLITRTNHAIALGRVGSLGEAESAFRSILDDAGAVLGPGHVITINAMNSYGRVLERSDRVAEAEPVYREALALADEHLSPTSKQTLELRNNLGMNLLTQGRAPEALPVLRASAELHAEAHGEDNVFTALARGAVGKALMRVGGAENLEEAERLLRGAFEGALATLPPGHPAVGSTRRALEELYGPGMLDRPDRLGEIGPPGGG